MKGKPIPYSVPNRKVSNWFYPNPNMKDGVLDPEGKTVKTAPILVENGETVRVPYGGVWQPFNHDGEAVHLENRFSLSGGHRCLCSVWFVR